MESNFFKLGCFLFVVLVGVILHANAQPPIPQYYPGHSQGSPYAPIYFEVFIDHLCIDSKNAWPVMEQVLSTYGNDLYFIIHVLPLPYHRNSFFATQAGLVVQSSTSNQTWFDWLTLMFEHQSEFYVPETMNATGSNIVDMLAKYAIPLGVSKENFYNGMEYGGEADGDARINYKFATARGVYGTPEWYINGVFVTDQATWTFSDWSQVIEAILGGDNIMNVVRDVRRKH